MMQSNNTMLTSETARREVGGFSGDGGMTINGTVAKTGLLTGITTATAAGAYTFMPDSALAFGLVTFGGLILAAIGMLACGFKPSLSPFTALPVSLGLGGFAGGSSLLSTSFLPEPKEGAMFESPEAAIFSALLLTMCITGGLLGAYATGLIRPNRMFRNIVLVGIGGLCLFALTGMVMALFGNPSVATLFSAGNSSVPAIGLSLVITGLYSAILLMDFQMVHQMAQARAPKHMEWYGSQAILYSMVYLYVQLLRLIVQLMNRD
ncbi:MAG: Bax inhibitor-1/YccA family protein [Planctomycetota bacterium]